MNTESAKKFETRFQNRLANLISAMEAAGQFLNDNGVGGQAAYAANLAIEELTTNTLKYGYDDTVVHEILLRVEILSDRIVLLFEDDGHEFNPLLAAEPDVNLPLEERTIGGLGIHLVRRFVQQMRYEHRDGRNRLTVEIRR
ncbi:MAG: ATP-binding protein [Verrucomicrobiia bacterium]|jgi:anti-sigma regulatory factor (Ser/Thr protein kinase)